MRVFARWVSLLFAVCLVGVSGTRVLARRDPPPEIAQLMPDEDCPAPCWAGLQAGNLSDEALHAWLEFPPRGWRAERSKPTMTLPDAIDYWQITPLAGAPFGLAVVRVREPGGAAIELLPADLTLGEAVAALGAPEGILFHLGPDIAGVPMLQYQVSFREGDLAATGLLPADASHLAPGTPVEALIYRSRLVETSALAMDWRGFGPMARYYPQGVVP